MKKVLGCGGACLVALVIIRALLIAQEQAKPQPPPEDYVKSHYTKYELSLIHI